MYLAKWKRPVIVLLILWAMVAFLISLLRCNTDDSAVVKVQLKRVYTQLETLRQEHSNLISRTRRSSRFKNLKDIDIFLFLDLGQGPTEAYENLKRRIYTNTKDLWYYIDHELTRIMTGQQNPNETQNILDRVAERKRSVLSDQDKLSDLDGYQDWRLMEAAALSELVQRRLHYLQNPPNCEDAKKLVCNLSKDCGFGCQLHFIVFCLIFANATERTLILNSRGWRYSTKGWEYVFHPLSDTCNSTYKDVIHLWPISHEVKVAAIRYTDSIDAQSYKPKLMPFTETVPKSFVDRIARFNGDPTSWWIGQIIKYILKPQARIIKTMNETIARKDFQSPIVGIHVRRSDKVGTEAQYHHIDEYMNHVKDYYDQLELTQPVDVRRVYLATDDATVLEEVRNSYPEYRFVDDSSIAKTAAPDQRYSPLSLSDLLVDLELLSRCDYIVFTMSSHFGRVAYELMQTNRVDASNSFFSLDDVYYYGAADRPCLK